MRTSSRAVARRARDGAPLLYGRALADQHALHKDAYLIPMRLSPQQWSARGQGDLLGHGSAAPHPNLSPRALAYVHGLEERASVQSLAITDAVWFHVLAIGYAPSYLGQNADGIRQDWPRVPLPNTRDALRASAQMGVSAAALLDTDAKVDSVTTGPVRHELRPLGVLASAFGSQLDPSAGDLALTAGWGHAGQGGVTMPGRGRAIERPYTEAELAALRQGLAALGLTHDQLIACLGDACCDVYISDRAYWRCVPARVWEYTIGGYQVIKKWLSYRERPILGRDLTVDEARYVTEMTRRIAAILLLEPALDENYERVKADTYAWPAP